MNKKTMNKLLVIGKEGRLAKYAPDPSRLDAYEITYAPVGARDEELLTKGRDADFVLVDAIGSISGNVIQQMTNLKLQKNERFRCGGACGAPDAGSAAGRLRRRPERPDGKTDRNQGKIYDRGKSHRAFRVYGGSHRLW